MPLQDMTKFTTRDDSAYRSIVGEITRWYDAAKRECISSLLLCDASNPTLRYCNDSHSRYYLSEGSVSVGLKWLC